MQRDKPTRNAFIESFNGGLRGALLNETLFPSLHHARAMLAAWRRDDNTERRHSRLGWQTSATFAQTFTPQPGLTLRNPQSSAPAPVAQPAQRGNVKRLPVQYSSAWQWRSPPSCTVRTARVLGLSAHFSHF
tara:strand:+ start:1403 stop:1798 length:396 start_codon:yes stop_codon:yes gene_type:complete